MADAPMLQRYPLKLFLLPLCRLWEREKRKARLWSGFHEVDHASTMPSLVLGW